tara:strand:- start:184 stop:423 length:240 start_codon:yes stop_codon:yes gene_type:complete
LFQLIDAVGIISRTLENASLLYGGSRQLPNVACESFNFIPLMINKHYDLITGQFVSQQEIKHSSAIIFWELVRKNDNGL